MGLLCVHTCMKSFAKILELHTHSQAEMYLQNFYIHTYIHTYVCIVAVQTNGLTRMSE